MLSFHSSEWQFDGPVTDNRAYPHPMRRLVVLVAIALVGTACGDEVPGTSSGAEATTTTTVAVQTPPTSEEDRIEVTALALRALVADYNSFGSGHRFTEVLLQTRIDPAAGSGQRGFGEPPGRSLTETERSAIEHALADLASVDRRSRRIPDRGSPTRDRGVGDRRRRRGRLRL